MMRLRLEQVAALLLGDPRRPEIMGQLVIAAVQLRTILEDAEKEERTPESIAVAFRGAGHLSEIAEAIRAERIRGVVKLEMFEATHLELVKAEAERDGARAELAKMTAERDEARGDAIASALVAKARVEKLEAQNKRWQEWSTHDEQCNGVFPDRECSCGLDALLAQVKP